MTNFEFLMLVWGIGVPIFLGLLIATSSAGRILSLITWSLIWPVSVLVIVGIMVGGVGER